MSEVIETMIPAEALMERPSYYLSEEHHPQNGTLLGFWLYLMSDCLVFACLFAMYGVLGRSYAGGPTGAELFDLPLVAVNTSLLLLSSITYGFAMLEMQQGRLRGTLLWLVITGLLGAGFIGVELHEFAHLIHEGAAPQRSAFLSSFFALVGTHGLHVTFGIIWLLTLLVQLGRHGLIAANQRRLMCLSMFWHFLDVVWIGVFTFVYLMGVLCVSTSHQADHGTHASHSTLKGYMTGFVLSVVLTAIPFWLVMGKVFQRPGATIAILLAFAAVQIVVHMVYFLHMNAKSEGGWSLLALIFTVVLVVIALSGSLWVMYHLNQNMMPSMMDMRHMP